LGSGSPLPGSANCAALAARIAAARIGEFSRSRADAYVLYGWIGIAARIAKNRPLAAKNEGSRRRNRAARNPREIGEGSPLPGSKMGSPISLAMRERDRRPLSLSRSWQRSPALAYEGSPISLVVFMRRGSPLSKIAPPL